MPYHHVGPQPDGGSFFNLEQSVGTGGVNNPADVKLVQYMIKKTYGSQAASLVVDGTLGQYTVPWINKVQFDARAAGCNVTVDGRLTRSLSTIVFSSTAACATLAMNRRLKLQNPQSYSQVGLAVRMNAAPTTATYTCDAPNAKLIRAIQSSFTSNGWRRTFIFLDGSCETVIDSNMSPSIDEPGHGKAVARFRSGSLVLSVYEDGTQKVKALG